MQINVVVADDHPVVRQGITQILELENDIKVIGQASNGKEAVNVVRELKPDIVLMDINMPILNGIQAMQKLKDDGVDSKIIVLTIHTETEYLVKTVQLGASGYVLKDAEANVLIDAIRRVYNGGTYIPSDLAAELIKGYNTKPQIKDEEELTDREIEVIKAIAEGMSNKEIAAALFISEKTVKNHISNIFRKLDISDRTQAAIYAIKHRIK